MECNKKNGTCVSQNKCTSGLDICCYCNDKRPEVIKLVNQFYIDGHGLIETNDILNISRYYCPSCKVDTISNAEHYISMGKKMEELAKDNVSINKTIQSIEKCKENEQLKKNKLMNQIAKYKKDISKINKLMKINLTNEMLLDYEKYKKEEEILNQKVETLVMECQNCDKENEILDQKLKLFSSKIVKY